MLQLQDLSTTDLSLLANLLLAGCAPQPGVQCRALACCRCMGIGMLPVQAVSTLKPCNALEVAGTQTLPQKHEGHRQRDSQILQ